jgi:hypothetical protein
MPTLTQRAVPVQAHRLAAQGDARAPKSVTIPPIQVDRSGVGHCWVDADATKLPKNIEIEIECEILDGGVAHTDDYVASNGLHYRW